MITVFKRYAKIIDILNVLNIGFKPFYTEIIPP